MSSVERLIEYADWVNIISCKITAAMRNNWLAHSRLLLTSRDIGGKTNLGKYNKTSKANADTCRG